MASEEFGVLCLNQPVLEIGVIALAAEKRLGVPGSPARLLVDEGRGGRRVPHKSLVHARFTLSLSAVRQSRAWEPASLLTAPTSCVEL